VARSDCAARSVRPRRRSRGDDDGRRDADRPRERDGTSPGNIETVPQRTPETPETSMAKPKTPMPRTVAPTAVSKVAPKPTPKPTTAAGSKAPGGGKGKSQQGLPPAIVGNGGEVHQVATGTVLTTNQGIPVSDNQNSLKSGRRGPTLLEDFLLREKITQFDHERIPERIVHARGSAAHGFFEVTRPLSDVSRADFLQRKGERTPVFVRFSTVAGGAGSIDTPRDVRGFAVKFYTKEGNFDLVGNNIPVFFIQDAIKFPDLVHSVKMEPDRAFPQAASAHDTFWDFMSLMPESTHMIMWAMSDRGIPRSYRTMEGFGVHTFRLVDARGKSTFVKFHWRPKIGSQSLVWDEAVKLGGADYDYHRRDLWNSIADGAFPEYTLSVQLFTEEQANEFDFDVLDATKIIPEEVVPLREVGRLVLDRNPDNFFAETEQVAFCPANIVPGIDFSNDPLLQGRLFSYLDTQLSRLGGPNFHEIPINAPKCPMHNFNRDGHMRTTVPKGRVNYEPNTLGAEQAREEPQRGYRTFPHQDGEGEQGDKLRSRPESFADHYSQARQFYLSQTEPEQNHIVGALVFELSKVETPAIRERVIGHMVHVDRGMADRIAAGLGLEATPPAAPTGTPARDLDPSPPLSILAKQPKTIEGRVVGCLVTEGVDGKLIDALAAKVGAAGAKLSIVAPKIGGVTRNDGKKLPADHTVTGGPSVLFDAVVVAASKEGVADLLAEGAALDWVGDAFGHLKIIGHTEGALPLLEAAGVTKKPRDPGLVALGAGRGVDDFVTAAKRLRIWDREPHVRVLH
jgi:catalase